MDLLTDERISPDDDAPWPDASVEFVATGSAPALRVARTGHGKPLLLINGLGANLEMWQPLVGELAGERELIAFDLPGTGRSARRARLYLAETLPNGQLEIVSGGGHLFPARRAEQYVTPALASFLGR